MYVLPMERAWRDDINQNHPKKIALQGFKNKARICLTVNQRSYWTYQNSRLCFLSSRFYTDRYVMVQDPRRS